MEALQQDIARLLQSRLHLEAAEIEGDLLDSGVIDSVQLVTLIVALEERFGVTIPLADVDFDSFRSIESLAALVVGLRSSVSRAAT